MPPFIPLLLFSGYFGKERKQTHENMLCLTRGNSAADLEIVPLGKKESQETNIYCLPYIVW